MLILTATVKYDKYGPVSDKAGRENPVDEMYFGASVSRRLPKQKEWLKRMDKTKKSVSLW